MSDNDKPPESTRDGLRRKALQHQTEKDNRKAAVYEEMQTDRVVSDAKTARLRALRLAKEKMDAAGGGIKAAPPDK